MGINAQDLNPIGTNGPTVQTPPGKQDLRKFFQVSRTDTAAGIIKAMVPASSSVVSVVLFGNTNSNAGTTATVTITIQNAAGTIATGTVNVLTNGATTAQVTLIGLPNIQPIPATGDIQILARYAETGTASSAGGPWTLQVSYVA